VQLEVPVSPHLADLQPEDASTVFHYTSFALSLSPAEDRAAIGFVELYGKSDVPGTVITLNPGEWIRVQGTLRFLSKPLPQGELHLISGYWLNRATFHPRPGGYSTALEGDCVNSHPTPSVPFQRD
jgi:hypothetical protein